METQCPLEICGGWSTPRCATSNRLSRVYVCPSKGNVQNTYDNFLRICKLSPSALRLALVDEVQRIRIFSIDQSIYDRYRYYIFPGEEGAEEFSDEVSDEQQSTIWTPDCEWDLGENVYDILWTTNTGCSSSSLASSSSGVDNLVLVSSKDHPLNLYHVSHQSAIAQYVGYDHLDEVETTFSLANSLKSPHHIYAGCERKIRCFDLNRPGKSCLFTLATSKTKNALFGQKGIISTISFAPDYSGLFAAGSYEGNCVSIYSEDHYEHRGTFDGGCGEGSGGPGSISQNGQSIMDMTGFPNGISCLQWSPCGNFLWVGVRNHRSIYCYDVRNSKKQVLRIDREWNHNLKTLFSLDPWGKYLCAGDSSGKINFFDTQTGECVHSMSNDPRHGAIGSTVGACIFHPFASLLITTSGDRRFNSDEISTDESDDCDSERALEQTPRKISRSEQRESESSSIRLKPRSALSLWKLKSNRILYEIPQSCQPVERNDVSNSEEQ